MTSKSKKRYQYFSDSDESDFEYKTQKMSSIKRSQRRQSVEEMVNNEKSVKTSNISQRVIPFVSLNRNEVEIALKRQTSSSSHPKDQQMNGSDPQQSSSAQECGQPLSGDQLRRHYEHCIQLSICNKINDKNAFSLQLIDLIFDFINDKHNQRVDFRHIGCALECGAKIYCHRVDVVHAEARKVATTLSMAFDGNNNNNNNRVNEVLNNCEFNDIERDIRVRNKSHKTSKRFVNNLVQNIESITLSKVDKNPEIDPIFHSLSSDYNIESCNSLLMQNLKSNSSGMLLLNSNISIDCNQCSEPIMQSITHFCQLFEDILNPSFKICPQLSNFEFLNRNSNHLILNEEDICSEPNIHLNTDINEPQVVEDMELEEVRAEDVISDNIMINDSNDLIESQSLVISNELEFNNFENMLNTITSPQRTDRSPTSRNRRHNKLYSENDYFSQSNEDIFDTFGSSQITLNVSTLQNWKNSRLPDEYILEMRDLSHSFINPEFRFRFNQTSDSNVSQNETNLSKNESNLSNSHINIDNNVNNFDENAFHFNDSSDLGQNSSNAVLMIDERHDSEDIPLSYAKAAKKIDLKKLKKEMFEIIEDKISSHSELTFSDLYLHLPERLPTLTADNLSVSIAFVSLLHLCNEKNLELIGREDMEDFTIKQELE